MVFHLDSELLNKALDYSKKAYEEALQAKEASLRVENALADFIQSIQNNHSETSNVDSKGHNKKVRLWYTVGIIYLSRVKLWNFY